MYVDEETLDEWIQAYETAPRTDAAGILFSAAAPTGSVDLLPHMAYVPSERNQGACGNCWAWAGIGCMEIALSTQEGVQDRLSVQVLNSCRGLIGKSCCAGGWLSDVARFYSITGQALPWSNPNASWQDGSGGCTVPCEAISTEPCYYVEHIEMLTVPTLISHGVTTQAQAIANIKNVLDSGRGIWFAFFVPTESAWQQFTSFWSGNDEASVINLDGVCAGSSTYAGHAVLCVGYDDTDPDNRYWLMLNSWGTAGGRRPNGLFRVNMDMDYNTRCGINAFRWQALDMEYSGIPRVTTNTATLIDAQSATLNGTLDHALGSSVEVRFEYGATPAGPYLNATDWQTGVAPGDTFSASITGLNPGATYFARACARDSASYGYGDDVSFTTLPLAPSDLRVVDTGTYHVELEWTPGEGAQWTHVRVKQGSYPTDREDGDAVYDGPDSSYVCGPLDPGATHYFRAWSRTLDANGGPVWSDDCIDVSATTISGDPMTSLSMDLHAGWNMVSVPLNLLGFDDLTRVFPGALAAYSWNGTTYEPVTRIEPGAGFWVAIPETASGPLVIRGLPSEVQSCELLTGWNLVGSLSEVASLSLTDLNVVGASGTETLNLVHVYWWDGASYVAKSEIAPGTACWVDAPEPCTVTVNAAHD